MLYLNKLTRLIICFIALVALGACATAYDKRGVYHRVRKGESIGRIARYYHVSVQDLAEWNNIQDPSEISEGFKLYIPKAKYSKPRKHRKIRRRRKSKADNNIEFERGRFIWPVDGPVFSKFGIRKGRRHDGIDISAKRGTPIKAAASGKVVFNGRLRGYGNMLILKHKGRFFTVYAHSTKNIAAKGQRVAKGETIGYVGSTGRASGPHLHFEVRQGQKARNPLFFLPATGPKTVEVAVRDQKGKKSGKRESARIKKKKKQNLKHRKEMMKRLKAKKSK